MRMGTVAALQEELSKKDARRGGWQRGQAESASADRGRQVRGRGRGRLREGAGVQTVRLLEQTVWQGASKGIQAAVVRVRPKKMLHVLLQESAGRTAARTHRHKRRVLQLRPGGRGGPV